MFYFYLGLDGTINFMFPDGSSRQVSEEILLAGLEEAISVTSFSRDDWVKQESEKYREDRGKRYDALLSQVNVAKELGLI